MAVIRTSVEQLVMLEQELSAIFNESRNLDLRLRSAADTLSSIWEGAEVSVLLEKLHEMYQVEYDKAEVIKTLVQLIQRARETIMVYDADIAASIRNKFGGL